MEIRIDHKESQPIPADAADVLAVLGGISDDLRKQGRAIVKVAADGRSVPCEDVANVFRGVPVTALASLEIETASVAHLVNETLQELEQTAPELSVACHSLAEVFQGQEPESGYEPFEQLAGYWKAIKEREMLVAGALGLNWEDLRVEDTPVGRMHQELNDYLAEAADAIKAGDCVLLGDLLEYELAPRAEAEPQIVALLREKAAQVAS